MIWVREGTIPSERPPLVGEVIAELRIKYGCYVNFNCESETDLA
jgi:hypothetical protein